MEEKRRIAMEGGRDEAFTCLPHVNFGLKKNDGGQDHQFTYSSNVVTSFCHLSPFNEPRKHIG